jgi:hypothetical protein
MDLKVLRKWFTSRSSIGELFINGAFECYTLEDRTREPFVKIRGETAIPYGKYEVVISWSDHFNKLLPLLMRVPQFDGIRIHSGNAPKDTEGCILVGQSRAEDFIGASRDAFKALFPKLQSAAGLEKIFIEIVQAIEEDSRV